MSRWIGAWFDKLTMSGLYHRLYPLILSWSKDTRQDRGTWFDKLTMSGLYS